MKSNAVRLPLFFVLFSFSYSVLILAASCGLEYVLTLNPPEYIETSVSGNFFRIMLTNNNSESEFRGVEFFYKFYGKDDIDLDTNLLDYDELISGGFERVYSENDVVGEAIKPLLGIPIANRGYRTQITLDFSEITDVHIYAEGDEANGYDLTSLPIRRSVAGESNQYKTFNDFDSSDSDIFYIGQDFSVEPEAKLLIYALSFGKKDISTDTFSKAVCLFNIVIDINITT